METKKDDEATGGVSGENEYCKNCYFSRLSSKLPLGDNFWCLRYPPRERPVLVNKFDWCGEFSGRDGPTPPRR